MDVAGQNTKASSEDGGKLSSKTGLGRSTDGPVPISGVPPKGLFVTLQCMIAYGFKPEAMYVL